MATRAKQGKICGKGGMLAMQRQTKHAHTRKAWHGEEGCSHKETSELGSHAVRKGMHRGW